MLDSKVVLVGVVLVSGVGRFYRSIAAGECEIGVADCVAGGGRNGLRVAGRDV